ncbi:MAG: uracil-DNA glycosylase family protein, partial [Bacteroidales bacterium]|nr:uracil-DNA glycosylase family protein [Bacteroidales bacterium]
MSNTFNEKRERHPLKPFISSDVKVMMIGSFPPARSKWNMEFYYPNFQNDMW